MDNLRAMDNRNARKSIKGSKDLDASLVSNENLSEILPSSAVFLTVFVSWPSIATQYNPATPI